MKPDPRFPPRLTMDEYVAFIEASMKHVTREQVDRQKAIEERILKPFKWVDEPAPAAPRSCSGPGRRDPSGQ